MPKLSFDFRTAVPRERVMAMLTDFSPNRPEIWPMLAPELYEVHRLDAGSASVKEGSTFPRRIWERDDYEWSADRVRWTVRDSNYCQPGSYVEVSVRLEADGGTRLHVDWWVIFDRFNVVLRCPVTPEADIRTAGVYEYTPSSPPGSVSFCGP